VRNAKQTEEVYETSSEEFEKNRGSLQMADELTRT
jgi:hypothetical protein